MDDFVVTADGNVGIGVTSTSDRLRIVGNSGQPRFSFAFTSGTTITHDWLATVISTGTFRLTDDDGGSTNNEFDLDTDGNLTLSGTLTIAGPCTGCDEVFEPGYPLETLEEHAALMWENKFLPGIGPTPSYGQMDVLKKTGGILNELEKAHIYIEQLHKQLEAMEARLAAIEAKDDQ